VDIHRKIANLVNDFNTFGEVSTGKRYWLDQRCLILLSHLYTEYLIKIISEQVGYSPKLIKKKDYQWKIDKLHGDKIIDRDLYENLDELNDARNTVSHNLNIREELFDINHTYLDMKSTKLKAVDLFTRLANLITGTKVSQV